MERQIVTIPRDLWKELEHDWHIDFGGQAAGVTQRSNTKVVRNRFPRFMGTPKFALIRDAIPKWRAIVATAEGHLGIYRVPMVDPLAFKRTQTTVSMRNGQTLNTGLFAESTPTIVAVGERAKGAGTITIDVQEGSTAPVAGQILSHGEDWPFVVKWADPVAETPGRYTLHVSPPLRAPIADGEEVRLEAIGRFEITDDPGLPAYNANRVVRASISLREVLDR